MSPASATSPAGRGEHNHRRAAAFQTPGEVIEYLKDGEGYLSRVAQRAIERACIEDPEFAEAFVGEVA